MAADLTPSVRRRRTALSAAGGGQVPPEPLQRHLRRPGRETGAGFGPGAHPIPRRAPSIAAGGRRARESAPPLPRLAPAHWTSAARIGASSAPDRPYRWEPRPRIHGTPPERTACRNLPTETVVTLP